MDYKEYLNLGGKFLVEYTNKNTGECIELMDHVETIDEYKKDFRLKGVVSKIQKIGNEPLPIMLLKLENGEYKTMNQHWLQKTRDKIPELKKENISEKNIQIGDRVEVNKLYQDFWGLDIEGIVKERIFYPSKGWVMTLLLPDGSTDEIHECYLELCCKNHSVSIERDNLKKDIKFYGVHSENLDVKSEINEDFFMERKSVVMFPQSIHEEILCYNCNNVLDSNYDCPNRCLQNEFIVELGWTLDQCGADEDE